MTVAGAGGGTGGASRGGEEADVYRINVWLATHLGLTAVPRGPRASLLVIIICDIVTLMQL